MISKFKNLKIKVKFMVVQAIIIGIFVISLIVAFNAFFRMSNTATTITNVNIPNLMDENLARKDIQSINKRLLIALIKGDAETLKAQKEYFDKEFVTMQGYMDNLKKNVTDQSLVTSLDADLANVKTSTYEILSLLDEGKQDAAKELYFSGFSDVISEKLANSLEDIGDYAEAAADTNKEKIDSLRVTSIVLLVVVLLIAVAMILVAFNYLSMYITNGINELSLGVQTMAKGDFSYQIASHKFGDDDLGDMVSKYNDMAHNTNEVITDVCTVLGEMAKGNFAAKAAVPNKYVGEYNKVNVAFEDIHDNLSNIFKNMADVATEVESRSAQIANGSMSLAQGATQQASTLEELSATIRDFNETIDKSAANAKAAEESANIVSEKIENENALMQEMLKAMNEIEQNAQKINEINKAIDDIAFQTNILSLNASVEAARAGSAGKGFAVVAGEVRNLAGKSQDAANETATLIQDTIVSVRNGAKIVSEAAQALSDVMENADKSQVIAKAISSEMQAEAATMANVTTGLEQISDVVQQNSATSEESSASCQELNGQAATLRKMVNDITY